MAKLVLRKLLIILALLSFLMCPLVFIGATFFPRTLAFLDPVLCPPGMHLDNEMMSQTDLRGNITAGYTVCIGDNQQQVDVTGKMLVILFGLAILGVVLLVAWALTGPNKEPRGSATSVK